MPSAHRCLRLAAAVVLLAVTAARAADESTLDFSFDQVSIRSFVKLVGEVTGRKFVVAGDVEGTITVVAPRIRRSEVFPLFVSILENAGCSVAEEGGLYRVARLGPRRAPAAVVVAPGTSVPPDAGLVTKVLHLEYVTASEAAKLLEPHVSGGGAGALGAIDETNHLIVTDTTAGLRRVEAILAEIDRPGLARMTEVVTLKNTGADDLAAQLSYAMAGSESRAEQLKKRLPNVPGTRADTDRSATVIAAPHANQVILVGTSGQLAEMRRIIEQMDVEAPPGRGRLNAIFLRYVSAEDAAKSLASLLAPTGAKDESGGPRRGAIGVQASPANNALLVDSSTADFDVVKRLIDQLDQAPRQVHVSVLIAEVSANGATNLGVEMAAVDMPGSVGDTVLQGGSMFTGGTESLMSKVQSGVFPQGITVGVAHGTQVDSDGKVVSSYPGVININALKQQGLLQIKSETALVAQDNREASVVVANQIPILKSQIQGGTGSARDVIQNIERLDVGVKLRLIPHVTPDDRIQMELHPTIEAVLDPGTTTPNLTPTIARREVSTTVTVPDGRMIVIAGLTREDKIKNDKRVPFLGSIPLLGWLFRTTSESMEKKNMLIFVTPRIVHDMDTADRIREDWSTRTGIPSSAP